MLFIMVTSPNSPSFPRLAVIIATTNEPASIVITLLESLLKVKDLNFTLTLADNSDLVFSDGTINDDALRILSYVAERRESIQLVRRSRASHVYKEVNGFRRCDYYGERNGGKAANLNLAISSLPLDVGWILVLDSDSGISASSLKNFLLLADHCDREQSKVAFIQGALTSEWPGRTWLSSSIGTADDLYYQNFASVKVTIGVVSNWGHGVLICRDAWNSTGGFPEAISEDLAWANEITLKTSYSAYLSNVSTVEGKPLSWNALRVQRFKWARGTTDLAVVQLPKLLQSSALRWHQKIAICYEMLSYINVCFGCFLPSLFLPLNFFALDTGKLFFMFFPAFLVVLSAGYSILLIETIRLIVRRRFGQTIEFLQRMTILSFYYGSSSSVS